jgi:hypothetical protein
VFPTTVVENYVAKLENKVRFFVSCHKIQTAKLCCDENNILIYLNDDDLRYMKREEIDKISLCEYDLSSCFKKIIAIRQKKDNNNLYVMLYGYDNQMNTLCNFYSELLTDSEFNSNKINEAFCEKELENIDLAVNKMLSKKPYTSVVDFSKIINQIRKMLNITVLNDHEYFRFVRGCFYDPYKHYYIQRQYKDFETSLIEPGMACLTEQCIQSLREYGFEHLFEHPEFVTWTLT